MNRLYWLSLILLGLSLVGLIGIFAFHLKFAATPLLLVMLSALLTRSFAYSGASFSLRKAKRSRAIVLAVYGVIWFAFAAFFFVFVVLRQFGITS